MRKILEKSFFSNSAPYVGESLLGMYLVSNLEGVEIASRITETEAYEGVDDLASHASKGKTPRTAVMFGEPGVLYVYLIYGVHFMLNVVTGKKDYPSAVLIRSTDLVRGPGRLTQKYSITKSLNLCAATQHNNLWFEDRGYIVPKEKIQRTPRIGVAYAGEEWAKKPWRFIIDR